MHKLDGLILVCLFMLVCFSTPFAGICREVGMKLVSPKKLFICNSMRLRGGDEVQFASSQPGEQVDD
jgi:hypothetical protein